MEEANDQASDQSHPPWEHCGGVSNDTATNLEAIRRRDFEQAIFTREEGVNVFITNQFFMDHAHNGSMMQTDNSTMMQETDILGEVLVSVPVTFMEKDVGDILEVSNSETLATASTINVSHGSSCDSLKKKTSVTWMWKKKDKPKKP